MNKYPQGEWVEGVNGVLVFKEYSKDAEQQGVMAVVEVNREIVQRALQKSQAQLSSLHGHQVIDPVTFDVTEIDASENIELIKDALALLAEQPHNIDKWSGLTFYNIGF